LRVKAKQEPQCNELCSLAGGLKSTRYKVLSTEKNLNNEIGVPQTLLNLNETYDAAVIEMGMNHHGEIRTLTNIAKPDIAVITQIGTAHMGNLGGTRADVYKAKMEIVEGLKDNGTLVLNGDDSMLSKVKSNRPPRGSNRHDVVFSGVNADGRNLLHADNIKQYWDDSGCGLSFTVCEQESGKTYGCELPVIGKHNVQNALLALTVGLKLGVEIQEGVEALSVYSRSSMRLETSVINGIKFIKDYYNASPESTRAALDTLADLGEGSLRIAILGDLSELGEQSVEIHREIADYTAGKANQVFYIGEYCKAFLEGRRDAHCFSTKEELNQALSEVISSSALKSGTFVLIKGSNEVKMWEQYEFIQRLLERGTTITAQTNLLVDVDAIKHNYSAIKSYVGADVQVMPVVKADGYGTGADLLAKSYSGCDFFAIADLMEAEVLSKKLPNARFLVLYQPFVSEVEMIVERDYIVASVCTIEFAHELNRAAIKAGKKVKVHIEIDTGMSRLGVFAEKCEKFAKVLAECENLIVEGIYTHYSSADMYAEADLEFTGEQTRRFKHAIEVAEAVIGDIPYKHACASAAIFNPRAELFNMVRPGYILRGYYPCEEMRDKIELRPALKYVTRVTQVEEYDVGTSISYGRTFVTERITRLAKIPVGYDDGLMRKLSNRGAFVIKGRLAPIVGRITMDYTMVDVTDIVPVVQAGDEVAIFDNVNMTIERMAELCETIGYEIITNIKTKAERLERF
jgi:alanine racemase